MHINSRQLNNYHHQARLIALNSPEMTTDASKLHGFKRADKKHAFDATTRLKHTLNA